ncbi:hypothetical protein [Sorangium cellulosum]|uniref:hypothetical protein n=1 Tax=Sorangium cellulosum TaxID=56 RepID=UPI0011DE42A2|nr:hypothetical protein [Sorangium cellulosum]
MTLWTRPIVIDTAFLQPNTARALPSAQSRPVGAKCTLRRGDEETLDEALAREGLSPPEHILEALGWLETEEAVRSIPFLTALGRVDGEGVLVASLLERAQRGRSPAADALAAYLRGWKESGREVAVDSLLRSHRGDPRLAGATALAVYRVGATDERVGWIVSDLRAGRLSDDVLRVFSFGGWDASVSDAALEELLPALLERGSRAALVVALWLVVHRQKAQSPASTRWREPLLRTLGRLADGDLNGLTQGVWEEGALELVKMDQVASALALVLQAMRARRGRGGSFGWEVLQACVERDPVATFRAVAALLEEDFSSAYAWALDLRYYGLSERFPVQAVLDWVGRSVQRAALAVELCNLDEEELPALARALLGRFGPDSAVASALAGRAHSTPHLVTSLAEFTADQERLAQRWAEDADPRVRRWAEDLLASLARSHEHHAAHEEHERRRWGT